MEKVKLVKLIRLMLLDNNYKKEKNVLFFPASLVFSCWGFHLSFYFKDLRLNCWFSFVFYNVDVAKWFKQSCVIAEWNHAEVVF